MLQHFYDFAGIEIPKRHVGKSLRPILKIKILTIGEIQFIIIILNIRQSIVLKDIME